MDLLFVETTDVSVFSHLKGQLGYLRRHGINVMLLAHDSGLLKEILSVDDVPGFNVDMERDPSLLRDIRSFVILFGYIRRIAPHTIVYGTPKAALLSAVVAWLLRIPRRVYFLYGLRAESMTGLGRLVMIMAERLIFALSTDVLSVGDELSERAHAMGINCNRMRVLGHGSANGVDVHRYASAGANPSLRISLRAEMAIPSEATVVGFVGRLTSDKGIDALVQAIAEVRLVLPEIYLLLVGPDEGIDRLDRSTRHGLSESWVKQFGHVRDTAQVYAAMDAFCLPSRREGLPTVLLEASAAAVPIVATDATGVADIIQDGVTGLVVPVDDEGALRNALLRVLLDPAFAALIANEAQCRTARYFDQQTVWEHLRRFYVDSQCPAGRKKC